jgi:hypothetical protein
VGEKDGKNHKNVPPHMLLSHELGKQPQFMEFLAKGLDDLDSEMKNKPPDRNEPVHGHTNITKGELATRFMMWKVDNNITDVAFDQIMNILGIVFKSLQGVQLPIREIIPRSRGDGGGGEEQQQQQPQATPLSESQNHTDTEEFNQQTEKLRFRSDAAKYCFSFSSGVYEVDVCPKRCRTYIFDSLDKPTLQCEHCEEFRYKRCTNPSCTRKMLESLRQSQMVSYGSSFIKKMTK